jgi:thiamine-monophosphate kinase
MSHPLTEFELIQQYFSDIGFGAGSSNAVVDLGVGDDCALLSIPPKKRLAVSMDTLLAGRHFPASAQADDIAQRALAVSVSDLAAMGAQPIGFTLALSIPSVDQSWLQKFSQGLRASADYYQIPLIGGDTTQGPLSLTIQVHGLVPQMSCLRRAGARPNDLVFVSGCLGDGAAALELLQNKPTISVAQQEYLLSRFYRPKARIALGQALLGLATAAIDISDGLLADLGHIARASAVGATINSDSLPVSEAAASVLSPDKLQRGALTGGDDYELCFTAGAEHRGKLAEIANKLNVPITAIGSIGVIGNNGVIGNSGVGDRVVCQDAQGNTLEVETAGYQHF